MGRSEAELRPAIREDLAWILGLLERSRLPTAGVADHISGFLVAEIPAGPAGCGALERYGSDALLRSVAVMEAHRGRGIGRQIVEALVSRAAAGGIRTLTLLTTSAEGYFTRLGFRAVDRSQVPRSIERSTELQGACPVSAAVLRLDF